ncbi:hypothetical protein ABZ816_33600 [Actinosynnema sp. NPDC047251]|uniref:hypothetical protein n=1 Tax=Saccharothrix espanaensis TaxID=103731 RepID=UPI0002D5C32B|nr:hypothetical protein [Saccharothrix espanaensis]
MNPVVAQVLTIVGVLLGSVATFVFTSAAERTRWRRAQAARWDDKRLLAYSEYGEAVKQMVRLCRRIAETKGLLSTGRDVDLDSSLDALAEAETVRAARWETVLLLGEPATIAAARAWSEQVWGLEQILRDSHPEASSFLDAYRRAMRLRNEFYDRARLDLGISSGPLPALTWKSLQPMPPAGKPQLPEAEGGQGDRPTG